MSSRMHVVFWILAMGVLCGSWHLQWAQAQQHWPSYLVGESRASENKIRATLDQETSLEFIETPLQDVVDYLKDRHNIEIQVDHRALESQGLGSDTPITRNLKGITFGSALRLMLSDLGLTYVIADEVLMITSPEEAEKHLEIRLYNVGELLAGNETADYLAQTIQMALDQPRPNAFAAAAGAGIPGLGAAAPPRAARSPRQITVFRTLLMVRDTPFGHERVASMLAMMKLALQPPPEPEPKPEPKPEPEKTDEPKPNGSREEPAKQ